jgi:hypothetical protein
MTQTDVERQVGSFLAREAEHADAGETVILAAQRRGRRLRTRRRVLTGVAAAAVVAVGIPAGLNVLEPAEQETRTVDLLSDPAKPLQIPDHPAKPPEVSIDLSALPKGDPPAIPWSEDGVIHSGDQSIQVPGMWRFRPVAGGYLALVEERVKLIDLDGNQIREFPSFQPYFPKVSADGRLFAALEGDGLAWPGRGTLNLYDSVTGDVVHRLQVKGKYPPEVLGFVGDLVAVNAPNGPVRGVGYWNPRTGEISQSPITGPVEFIDGRGRVVTPAPRQGNTECVYVLDGDTGRRLWKGCDVSWIWSSTDGRYLIANRASDGAKLVFEAATGRKLLEVYGTYSADTGEPEPNGDLLFNARDKQKDYLVRCSLYGACEIAAEVDADDHRTLLAWRHG